MNSFKYIIVAVALAVLIAACGSPSREGTYGKGQSATYGKGSPRASVDTYGKG